MRSLNGAIPYPSSELVGIFALQWKGQSGVLCTLSEHVLLFGSERKVWPLGAAHVIPACRAVFCSHTERYCIAITDMHKSRTQLIFWSNDHNGTLLDAKVCSTLSVKSGVGVATIFPNPVQKSRHDFILVLEDSTTVLLESAGGDMKCLARPHAVALAQAAIDDDFLYILGDLATNDTAAESPQDMHLTITSIDSSNVGDPVTHDLVVPRPSVCAQLHCLTACDTLLTCVWSSGTVTVLDTSDHEARDRAEYLHTLHVAQFQTPEVSVTPSGKKRRNGSSEVLEQTRQVKCQAVALNPSSVIIVAPNRKEGVPGIPYVRINAEMGIISESSTLEGASQSLSAHHHLMLAAVARSNPSESRGRRKTAYDITVAADGQALQWHDDASTTLAQAIGSSAVSGSSDASALFVLPYNTACNLDSSDVFVAEVLEQWDTERSSRELDMLSEAVNSFQKCNRTTPHIKFLVQRCCKWKGPRSSSAVLERFAQCLAESGLWDEVQRVVEAQDLSMSLCPQVVWGSIRAQRNLITLSCLRNLEHLPQQDVNLVLNSLLERCCAKGRHRSADDMKRRAKIVAVELCSHAEKCVKACAEKKRVRAKQPQENEGIVEVACAEAACAAAAYDGFTGDEMVLHALLASKLDVGVITTACKQLCHSSALFFLKYLRTWLVRMSDDRSIGAFTSSNWFKTLCCPSLHNVLVWIQALIDGQNATFIADRDAHEHIRCMSELVESVCKSAMQLQTCMGALHEVVEQSEAAERSWWHVSLLDMRVKKN